MVTLAQAKSIIKEYEPIEGSHDERMILEKAFGEKVKIVSSVSFETIANKPICIARTIVGLRLNTEENEKKEKHKEKSPSPKPEEILDVAPYPPLYYEVEGISLSYLEPDSPHNTLEIVRKNALRDALRQLGASVNYIEMTITTPRHRTEENEERPKKETSPSHEGFFCEDCGKPIEGKRTKNGKWMTPKQWANFMVDTYGKPICAECSATYWHKNKRSY